MNDKKPTKRQIQADKSRKKIYDTAMELFRTRGYDNISVVDIKKACGVSAGGFYHHFKSKESIIAETYSYIDEYFSREVVPGLKDKPYREQIREYIMFQVKFTDSLDVDIATQLAKIQLSENSFVSKDREFYTTLKQIVSDGQNNGQITKSMTSDEICDFILIFSRGLIYDWCMHGGEYNLPEATDKYLTRVLSVINP